MKQEPIRVALADDQQLVRHGLSYIINGQADMEVVGEAANGKEAVLLARRTHPDIILMDIEMPEYSGTEATRDIAEELPDIKIVILTTFDLEQYVYDGIRSGAVGYMLKDAAPGELVDAIHAAHRGEAIYRTAMAAKAMNQMIRSMQLHPERSLPQMTESFTERELEVLQQMAYGLRNEEIAHRLHISESTVKTHVHRILQKIGVEDRTQAVVYAIRNRIVH